MWLHIIYARQKTMNIYLTYLINDLIISRDDNKSRLSSTPGFGFTCAELDYI